MKNALKLLLPLVVTAVITCFTTLYLIKERNLSFLGLKFTEMHAFSSIADVENFDALEKLIEKDCKKEALEYVKQQREYSLLSIKSDFLWGQSVKNTVKDRSPEVYERALKARGPRSNIIPSC